jgi:hypothetical protein
MVSTDQPHISAASSGEKCLSELQPGVTLPFPDYTYRDFAAVPRSDSFPDANVAASMDVEDFDALDDDGFRRFGKVTKLPSVLWSEFCRLTLARARNNPGDCDAAVEAELESLVTSNICTPVSAPMPGVHTPTRSEEASMQAHQRNVDIQRRIIAGRVSDV